jgi:hypothetical protein
MCSAKYNFVVHAVHLPGKYNNIGDAFSCYQMRRFRELAPQANLLIKLIISLDLDLLFLIIHTVEELSQ